MDTANKMTEIYKLKMYGLTYKIRLRFGHYIANNQNSIEIFLTNGEDWEVPSVCLVYEILADDEVAIASYKCEHSYQWLKENGFISEPVRFVSTGYVQNVPICKILKRE